jgi:ATP-dependent DNA ligase
LLGLDWSDKYPSIVEALAKVGARTAYFDGELCGIRDYSLPSFSRIQAASDGSRGVRLVYFSFDLLHLDGQIARSSLSSTGPTLKARGPVSARSCSAAMTTVGQTKC